MEIREHIRMTKCQEGGVVLDVVQGKMYGLNPVASRILELLSSGLTETQIKSEISRQFTVDIEIVDRDVDQFLHTLLELQVVSSVDGSSSTQIKESSSQ